MLGRRRESTIAEAAPLPQLARQIPWTETLGAKTASRSRLPPHAIHRAPRSRKFLKVQGSPCISGTGSCIISLLLTPVLPLDARPTHGARVEGVPFMPGDLSDYRKEIDRIDDEILRLLNERSKNVVEIGKLKKQQDAGDVVLRIESVCAENDKGLPALREISFEIHQGEIYGLAGVAGNGQRELSQLIAGLRKCTKGKILLSGVEITNQPAHYAIQRGLAYVPEDRTHVGSSPNLSVTDNVIMKNYRQEPISHGWLIDTPAAQRFAKNLKEAYNIIVPSVDTPVRLLSGGNLQRVILAREISGQPALLVAVQPTRGLDVGAIEGVHNLLLAQREAGAAILLISEELEELLALSDRVAVIYEGRLMGEMRNPDVDTVGLMMTGTPLEQIKVQSTAGVEIHG